MAHSDPTPADVRCLIRGQEAEVVVAKAKTLPATAIDLEGIDNNRAGFGKVSPQDPGPWHINISMVQVDTLSSEGLSMQPTASG